MRKTNRYTAVPVFLLSGLLVMALPETATAQVWLTVHQGFTVHVGQEFKATFATILSGTTNPDVRVGWGDTDRITSPGVGSTCSPPVLHVSSCELFGTHVYEAPGAYAVRVRVYSADGSAFQQVQLPIQVIERPGPRPDPLDEFVLVSVGDSVASGEGAPTRTDQENFALGYRFDFGLTRPSWDDGFGPSSTGTFGQETPFYRDESPCHRSQWAHGWQLLRRLEAENPETDFTMLHYACSGADTGSVAGQIKALSVETKLRPGQGVDALLISAGANDRVDGDNSFGDVLLASCLAVGWDCSGDQKVKDALARKFDDSGDTMAAHYSSIATAIEEVETSALHAPRPIAQTYITEYYDPTKTDWGTFDTAFGCNFDLMTDNEWRFLYDNEVVPLNRAVFEAAESHAWKFVDGIANRFVNRGFCARDENRFVANFWDSVNGQHDRAGTAHPNRRGHSAIADQIYQNLLRNQPPRTTAEISHMPNVWTNQDVVVKLTARNLRGAGADELSWTLRRAQSGVVAQGSVQAQETTGATGNTLEDWLTGKVRVPYAINTLESQRALYPSLNGLTPLWSDDGRFRLIYQVDGNIVLYWGDEALWATNTVGSGKDGKLAMQDDGNLVLYDSTYRNPIWASNTAGHPGAYLTLQDDGNLVIYEPGNPPQALWATGTDRRRTTLSHDLTLSVDGEYQLEFSSANAHGVWEKPVFIDNILIDRTPPTTSWTISPSDDNGWHRTDVTVTLSGEDGGSGATALSYELRGAGAPGGPVKYESGPASATVIIAQEGITTLAFFSTDRLGNRENEKTITIRIDKTPPTIALTSPPPAANAAGWHREDIAATWSCADGLSGVAAETVTRALSTEGLNQSLEGTCVDRAGNTASHTVTGLNLDKTPPTIGFPTRVKAASPPWYREDITATWPCSDSLSGPVATSVTQTLSTEGVNQSLVGTCADRAGNAATHTLTGLNLDKTPPELTFDVATPAPNEHGWRTGEVTVGWTCSDALSGSGVSPLARGEVSFSSEGAGQFASATCSDPAGNATTGTVGPINIDRTPPLIALNSQLPAPNAAGWNRSDITATWSCDDGVSGPAAPMVTQTLSAEGVNQSLAGTCVDLAGNTTRHTVAGLNLDKTPPAIAFVNRLPAANQHGWANQDITATWSCHDALAGPASGSVSRTLASEGRDQSLTGTCDDVAANQASHTVTGLSLDKTAPNVVFGERSPAANAAGWNNSAVSVPFTPADDLSGVASTSVPSPLWFASEGAALTGSVSATDLAGNTATFVSPVVRIDLTPPTIACNATPATLWPPNHKLVPVSIAVPITDALSGAGGFILSSITVNEPAAPNDVAGFVIGTASTTGQLRATRAGGGSGRIYSLDYSGRDAAGNQATCASQILVPHDQGKN